MLNFKLSQSKLNERTTLLTNFLNQQFIKLTEEYHNKNINDYNAFLNGIMYEFFRLNHYIHQVKLLITDRKYLSKCVCKMIKDVENNKILDNVLHEPVLHLSLYESLGLLISETGLLLKEIIELYNNNLDYLTKTSISLIHIAFEEAVCALRRLCDYLGWEVDYSINNDLYYFDCKNTINANQETIKFSSEKTVLIISDFEGFLRAAKEFIKDYCPQINAKYGDDKTYEKLIIDNEADILIILGSCPATEEALIEWTSPKDMKLFIFDHINNKLLSEDNNLYLLENTCDLDAVFEIVANIA